MRQGNTYHILMRVHIDVEAIALGDPQHLDGMADPLLIVQTRALGLDSFPGENVSDGIVPVSSESRKVDMGVVLGEGPLVKGDVIAIEEVVSDLRGLIFGLAWVFCVACDVDAAEDDLAAHVVDELAVLDEKAERSHCG